MGASWKEWAWDILRRSFVWFFELVKAYGDFLLESVLSFMLLIINNAGVNVDETPIRTYLEYGEAWLPLGYSFALLVTSVGLHISVYIIRNTIKVIPTIG